VNLGELKGVLQLSSPRWKPRENNPRSSRRGREQMRQRTSEFGREVKTRRSDVITGDNPCKGARMAYPSFPRPLVSTFKCTTPQKAEIISASAAVVRWEL